MSLIAALDELLKVGISFGEAALSGFLEPEGACLCALMLFTAVAFDDPTAILLALDAGRE